MYLANFSQDRAFHNLDGDDRSLVSFLVGPEDVGAGGFRLPVGDVARPVAVTGIVVHHLLAHSPVSGYAQDGGSRVAHCMAAHERDSTS